MTLKPISKLSAYDFNKLLDYVQSTSKGKLDRNEIVMLMRKQQCLNFIWEMTEFEESIKMKYAAKEDVVFFKSEQWTADMRVLMGHYMMKDVIKIEVV